MFCLTTSVGTRMRHAIISPQLAAACCDSTSDPVTFLNGFLRDSYVMKNRLAPGADPSAAADKPE
eukprot:CAMPEP_0197535066 /NCGR_PEP_ID=MMETSP1318-20131121/49315_1 /TAXON_ID=552666 /ORGANISM="Partenskyella glossopodia, Strain RCC365" /LENGTH=64 /DNA_ID=CAMNT_0043092545 /DNA_START=407 /DNA_END=601 /DNA_ORIENTATION=-